MRKDREMEKKKVIEAINVSYIYQTKYQKTKALSEVSCSFDQGKVYAITGKSGSGKSTFLSLLAGLDVPSEGTLNIAGEDMRKMNRDDYRLNRASVIYQAFHLFPLLTAVDNVMFPMQLKHISAKEARARAEEYLKKVGLPETLYKKMPGMISGGEQQRVAIARALAKNPKLLLCDEPTGALDYNTGKAVLKLLQSTCRDMGKTVIVITHNQALTAMADRVITVKSGTVVSSVKNEEIADVADLEW